MNIVLLDTNIVSYLFKGDLNKRHLHISSFPSISNCAEGGVCYARNSKRWDARFPHRMDGSQRLLYITG